MFLCFHDSVRLGACGIVSIDSMCYSVRSVLGSRVTVRPLARWQNTWVGRPTPNWTRLRFELRQRAKRSSPRPGIRH
eukprot:3378887-Alexandrium_andersonii.AAC.1